MSESRQPRILHVDDDAEVLADAKEFLESEDIPGWEAPTVEGVQVFDEASRRLELERFDLVILDVRLGGHEPAEIPSEEEAGVVELRRIRDRRFVPVILWTNLPGSVRSLNGPLVRVHEKTEGLEALADTVRALFATELPSVNRALVRLLEEEQRRYMWDFVAENWDELQTGEDHAALAYLLARRLGRSLSGPGIQQLAEDLGEGSGEFPPTGAIHPAEMYLQPPLPEPAALVGDILSGAIDGREGFWLVLTPSCDLEHQKAEYVLLAAASPFEDQPEVAAWRAGEGNKDARRKAKKAVGALLDHATGGQQDRWLYLPGALRIPDLVVDYQQLRSVPEDAVAAVERVASLDEPFAAAAVSRFNRYYGRIGTPDLDGNGLLARLEAHPAEGRG